MRIVKQTPLYIQVYWAIKESIIDGKINYGERINEVKISQKLNVSRGPVRESISKLEQEGLLVRNEKNALFVYTPNEADLKDIYECRRVLESLAAEKAANEISEESLAELEKLMEESSKIIENDGDLLDTTSKFLDLNSDFHDIIIEASGNVRLQNHLEQLRSITRLYRKFNIHNQKRRKIAHDQHYYIFIALKERDASKAAQLMSKHIQYDMESLLDLYTNQQ